jgi:predicted kinase
MTTPNGRRSQARPVEEKPGHGARFQSRLPVPGRDPYDRAMPRLILLNGAPGIGKTTIARLLAERTPFTLAFSIDDLKHSLGRWADDPSRAKAHARMLGVVLIREQLALGQDVILAQYIVRPGFIDELASDAADLGASFHEITLTLPPQALATRIAERLGNPRKDSLELNNRMVVPADAPDLTASITTLLLGRPRAERIDASGTVEETLARVVQIFELPGDDDEG